MSTRRSISTPGSQVRFYCLRRFPLPASERQIRFRYCNLPFAPAIQTNPATKTKQLCSTRGLCFLSSTALIDTFQPSSCLQSAFLISTCHLDVPSCKCVDIATGSTTHVSPTFPHRSLWDQSQPSTWPPDSHPKATNSTISLNGPSKQSPSSTTMMM